MKASNRMPHESIQGRQQFPALCEVSSAFANNMNLKYMAHQRPKEVTRYDLNPCNLALQFDGG